jgi:diamine N-acetyltransferase
VPGAKVTLREVTSENHLDILGLRVRDDQQRYVASNAKSIAQAHFSQNAWMRAIYADGTPVGFLMVARNPEGPGDFLWRFMIDAAQQGKGYAWRAMELLVEETRRQPHISELVPSYLPGDGSAGSFYSRVGFEHTGDEVDGERLMRLRL